MLELLPELNRQFLQVDVRQQLFHRLGAHSGVEVVLILLPQFPVLFLRENLILGQRRIAGVRHNIRGKVEHLFQNPGGQVQKQAHPGGNPLEIPDVRDRRGQFNVAHPLPADVGPGDLYAAAVTDFALIADLLILAAVALPVLGGAKDPFTEQAVPLGLQGAVIDGLRLFYLAIGPVTDLFRGSDTNTNGVKLSITHIHRPPFRYSS